MSIRAVLVPQNRISELLGSLQGWFASDELSAVYEMQTSRELVWVIRGELMSPDNEAEHTAALKQLRALALEVMMPEIESVLGERPQGPLSVVPFKMPDSEIPDLQMPDSEMPDLQMPDT
ncbi:MAG: hypothetical protein AAF703_07385 [Cyanobacteria bacterium P01_D01_bin.105]